MVTNDSQFWHSGIDKYSLSVHIELWTALGITVGFGHSVSSCEVALVVGFDSYRFTHSCDGGQYWVRPRLLTVEVRTDGMLLKVGF